jgi:DNA-binding MarR family transcriptional regulator
MNTINHEKTQKHNFLDCEILKNLMSESSRSIDRLQKDLSPKLGKTANYPTVRRHVNDLEKNGYLEFKEGVRKNGRVDKRKTHNVSLTFKGLAYILLRGPEFTDSEITQIINKVSKPSNLQLSKDLAIIQIPVEAFRKTMSELRPKVNLEFFDEEYMMQTFFVLLRGNVFEYVGKFLKKKTEELQSNGKKSSKRHMKEMRRQSIRDAKAIPEQYLTFIELWKEDAIKERKALEDTVDSLECMLKGIYSIRSIREGVA